MNGMQKSFVLYNVLGGKEGISETVQHGFDEKVIKVTDWAVHMFESDNSVIDCNGLCAEAQQPEDRCGWKQNC